MNALFADEPLVLDDPYMSRMSEEEFFTFCQQHRKWRIERNAQQEILIMAPTFSITGRRNASLIGQLYGWWENHGEPGFVFDSNAEKTGVPSLLRKLSDLGIAFKDLNTRQSSLEDIFVSLVHREPPQDIRVEGAAA